MKKIILLAAALIAMCYMQAQLLKKIKDKVDNQVGKKIDDATNGNKDKKATEEKDSTIATAPAQPASLKVYSKYDFVPGEKVIGFEDFSATNIGDFPAGWNTNASAEVVTIDGKPGRWLWLTKPGEFVPELAPQYPEDFTLEFDLLHGIPFDGGSIYICIAEMGDEQMAAWPNAINQFTVELATANTGTESGVSRFTARKNYNTDINNTGYSNNLSDKNNPVHVAIWRQKERVRVYVNEEKLWDVPRATLKEAKFNRIILTVRYAEEVVKHYLGNFRLAVGAPDTRKKMLEQNKWVTHGILFDINSDKIRPESYGTLKEMANVLKEYADLKVKIVGHTDADGTDANNLDLSKRRAGAVKDALAKEFGIDAARMETDGKGESEPIDKNDNPAGKANNRRVEFIKI